MANSARFAHVESCESEDGREAVDEFWQRAVEGRSEGLMIKVKSERYFCLVFRY